MGPFFKEGEIYYTPCLSAIQFPALNFVISGQEFSVAPESYILELDGICVILIESLNLGPSLDFWILGMPFMMNVYTYFDMDNEKIGFLQVMKRSSIISYGWIVGGAACLLIACVFAYYYFKRRRLVKSMTEKQLQAFNVEYAKDVV